MSQETSRRTSVTRKILSQIIDNQQLSSTHKTSRHSPTSLEIVKLNEALAFLERKVERQYSEIKVISDQLSKQISLREQCAGLLLEEKNKSAKLNQHLNNANKTIAELKKKISKAEQKDQNGWAKEKQDYQLKINKYRGMMRKKDELLTKHQNRIQQLINFEQTKNRLELQLNNCKQAYSKLRNKEETEQQELQKLRKKNNQLEQLLQQNQTNLHQTLQVKMFVEEKLRRAKVEMDELSQETTYEIATLKNTMKDLRKTIEQYEKHILEVNNMKSNKNVPSWSLTIYTNQIKRILNSILKDGNFRRKVEKSLENVLSEMEESFNNIIKHLTSE